MSSNTCGCGKPTRDDAYVCEDDLTELAKALGEVPWVTDQLEVSITRQRAAAIGGGSRSTGTPLPWHEKASQAQRALHGTLASWVMYCTEERVRHQSASEDFPADNAVAMSRWLLWRVDGLAFNDGGYEATQQIADAIAEAHRIVFWKRRERIYLGKCAAPVIVEETLQRCDGEVYADEGKPIAYCDNCATEHNVEKRRAELEEKLDDRLCTAAEIARLATYLGLDQSRDQIRNRVNQWHKRGRLPESGHDPSGDPVYRYGTVRALLASLQVRDTA